MSNKTVLIRTDADGDFTYVRDLFALVRAIAIDIGDLETPDILIEDDAAGTTLFADTAIAASAYYNLGVTLFDDDGIVLEGAYGPPVCFGRLKVTVAGGGNTKTGSIRFLLET